MKLKELFLLGLFFATSIIYAQTDFRPGYILKSNGDTFAGVIDYRGDALMGTACRFKAINDTVETTYSPDDIAGYRFKESKYFVSKEFNGKRFFLEFLVKGKIDIFYHKNDKGDHYYLAKDSAILIEIPPYETEIKEKDGIKYLHVSKKYMGMLMYYMQDAPGFQERIASMGNLEHKTLIKLAKDYHSKVCSDRACIVYEKKIPPLKVDLEIVGGLINFYKLNGYVDNNYFQTGIITHFCLPRLSEKLFVRTGVLFSTLESDQGKESLFKIPLQLEYVYPKGIIRPRLAYGINIYLPFFSTCELIGGVNIKINKLLNITLNCNLEFNQSEIAPIIPRSVFSNSILAGLLIKL
ncbi:MAG: hypothetical protein ACOYOV_05250 [Bacteroidales bacterium]